jgi:hypothetical protein
VELPAELSPLQHADELRQSWQGRALAAASDKTGAVVLSVLAHNFDDAMPILLRAVFPGFTSIAAPFLISAGKVAKTGHVCADVARKDGKIARMTVLYRDVRALQNDFRRLADRCRLSDGDRNALFGAVKRWLVCDYRLDPTMDPRDPDARRLTVN